MVGVRRVSVVGLVVDGVAVEMLAEMAGRRRRRGLVLRSRKNSSSTALVKCGATRDGQRDEPLWRHLETLWRHCRVNA